MHLHLPALLSRLRALRRDRRGTAIMEFAFVAGPLIALIMAGLETSLLFVAQQTVETAAQYAGRQILTGSAQAAGTTQPQFKTLVCGKLPGFMNCANTFVDVRTSSSFALTNMTTPTITYDSNGNPTSSWAYASPNPGDIVVLRVMYLWPIVDGPFGLGLSNQPGGARLLVATSVFKVEKYK